jgi:hypothetical protein
MKSMIKFVIVLSLVLMGSGEALAQWGSKKVKGNGNVTSRTVNTSNYDAIKNFGSIDVHLKKGTEGNIVVKTDENLQEYIIVEVVDNALKIRTENNVSLSTKNGIHVYVPFNDISEVSLTGSGDVDTEDPINGDELKITLTGSGDVDLAVAANTVNATLTGSGDVAVRGTTTNLNLRITGSGDFNGNDLRSQNTEVTVSGSGDAIVYASKFLKARVHGSGDVVYKGNPEKRDTNVSGSGRISMN